MRLSYLVPVIAAFLAAAILAVTAAGIAVAVIERQSAHALTSRLILEGHDWASIEVDGLQVRLSGQAPDEATRFRAVSAAGSVVDPTRIIDDARVGPGVEIAPPRYSVEILRNEDDISVIGLAPKSMDRDGMMARVGEIAGDSSVSDLLEMADYPKPEGWDDAFAFGLAALARLERAKISIASGQVAVRAITTSTRERDTLTRQLNGIAPSGVVLDLDIAAPRPVVTPFTLRFLIDARGPRFDACTAYSAEGRDRILAAATAAGATTAQRCRLGLGVPSPYWPDAAVAAIQALARLQAGSVTLSDADVTLLAERGTDPVLFDRVAGELETALPDVFSLNAVLPEPEVESDGEEILPEFVATLSPEGLLQLRGRMPDDRIRTAVHGFALGRFGGRDVDPTMRIDETLPAGWATRVLAALEALSYLDNGSVRVQPETLEVRGRTGNVDANDEISRVLSGQLGAAQNFVIDVVYEEALDPVVALPTPEECVADINAILRLRKITFAPGSAEIDREVGDTLDEIAEVLRGCEGVEMEIGGHTDSQGREEMNQRLSQNRAEAVLSALLARRVLTSDLTARGYGEAEPIADNDTEEGREENRRIEFKLAGEEAEETDTAEADADADAEDGGDDAADAEGADNAPDTEAEAEPKATDEASVEDATSDGEATDEAAEEDAPADSETGSGDADATETEDETGGAADAAPEDGTSEDESQP